jgi:Virulence protein RhuM family
VVQRDTKSRVARVKRSRIRRSREKLLATMNQSSGNGGGEVVIYEAPDGQISLDVHLEHETVWLTQAQMAELFDKNVRTISEHVRNIFKEKELDKSSVIRNFRITARDGKTYDTQFYSLDAIISVGYRVKSKRGTQFRIWATRTLKDHLLRGYTLNEKRLRERGLGEIEQAVGLLARTLTQNALVTDEGRAALEVVQQYTRAWKLLLEYDEGRLAETPVNPLKPAADLSLDDARTIIARLRETLAQRGEATNLFGAERGDQLHGILGAIDQTFGGEPLCILPCRLGPLTSSTSLSKTIRSPTVTNASERCSSSNISGAMACSRARTDGRVLQITRWWHWRCSWRKANRRKRI